VLPGLRGGLGRAGPARGDRAGAVRAAGPREAALAVCANYLPVARAARLVAALTGVKVSAGFVAGVRGKAAARLGPFMDRARELLHAAPVLYADETPARAAGKLRYVHVACTEFLTAMHTGDRMGKAKHLKSTHTEGTTHITTRRKPARELTAHLDHHGHRAGETMATNLELTGRTPAFSRGR
jgi:hypothetical protein